MVFSLLQAILNKLKQSPGYLEAYNKIISEQLKAGFIERVEEASDAKSAILAHYFAHHAIVKESDTTALRIVFDCSAKATNNSASLNECLYSGPFLSNDLISILMRFRLNLFACAVDISKGYLQVNLQECDRDFTSSYGQKISSAQSVKY